jgi:adenylyl- and sulfurtransferase ThiI
MIPDKYALILFARNMLRTQEEMETQFSIKSILDFLLANGFTLRGICEELDSTPVTNLLVYAEGIILGPLLAMTKDELATLEREAHAEENDESYLGEATLAKLREQEQKDQPD